MATFLDATILRGFGVVFTFLLVWVVVFGILEMSGFGKERKGLAAIIALALAILVLLTPQSRLFIEILVPWITVFAIAVFFLLFVFMAFGVGADTFKVWAESGAVKVWVYAICIVIALIALGGAFGQPLLDEGEQLRTGEYQEYYVDSSGLSTQGEIPLDENGEPIENYDAYPEYEQVEIGVDGRTVPRNTFADNLLLTVTHPKVLGLVFILLLGAFTIVFLSRN
ncbi:hypothetical protein ACFL1B_03960 [Nanoarchaeota archaeon]